ncbi:MAG: TonB-dependent receptor [Leeuwenhoekiella sp.]
MLLVTLLSCSVLFAQDKVITGTVQDNGGVPLPGVTVQLKGTTIGEATDFDGNYTINVNQTGGILIFSFIGMATQEVPINGRSTINVTLSPSAQQLDDIVVVGYGTQRKESVVGSIAVATGDELLQAGGVTNVGEALQGRLPGVIASSGNGQPGRTDPRIFIRGQGSWNNGGAPLILVDGIERPIGDIDVNEIAQISVLKDASATAVFGVKGANGVIQITTKRGFSGKTQLAVSANTTFKAISKLPQRLEAYDGIGASNNAILNELEQREESWEAFTPEAIRDRFLNPANEEDRLQYPNVDWEDVLLKDFAQDARVNLTARGGNDFVKYFGSLAYQSTKDIFAGTEYDNGKGYETQFRYDRVNFRSNLDFNITKSTVFTVNLAGYYGEQEQPSDGLDRGGRGLYQFAPSIYTPVYPDGLYGQDIFGIAAFRNPITGLISNGSITNDLIGSTADFILEQDLGFITDGLSASGRLSYDYQMSGRQSLNDNGQGQYDNAIFRIYDLDFNEFIESPDGTNEFAYTVQPWDVSPLNIQDGQRARRLTYRMSTNYTQTFAEKHNVTGLALFQREEFARGSTFPSFREDWVGRITYDYDRRYLLEVNGAYNGSEKFGPGFRFDFFPSLALGWVVTNEKFMQNVDFLNNLKFRGSYGIVGDDLNDTSSNRFLFRSQFDTGGFAFLGGSSENRSPYPFFSEATVGNPNIQWETAEKLNVGVELGMFRNAITLEFDYFTEDRDNIFIRGEDRTVPQFFGINPPAANTGRAKVEGFEFLLGLKHKFSNGIDIWSDLNYTRAVDEVIAREDPALRPFYQNAAGYIIGQPRDGIQADILESWDDIYSATPLVNAQFDRRPGYYNVVDFNGDGVVNPVQDNAPFGYSDRPQNTFTWTLGGGYKGFRAMVMLYGAQNAHRVLNTRLFSDQFLYWEYLNDYYTTENRDAETTLAPWTLQQGAEDPARLRFDATVIRLRSAEVSYTVSKEFAEKIGVSGLKLFVNGNNLALWTDLPDDREFNQGERGDLYDYPTLRRVNLGFNLNF